MWEADLNARSTVEALGSPSEGKSLISCPHLSGLSQIQQPNFRKSKSPNSFPWHLVTSRSLQRSERKPSYKGPRGPHDGAVPSRHQCSFPLHCLREALTKPQHAAIRACASCQCHTANPLTSLKSLLHCHSPKETCPDRAI